MKPKVKKAFPIGQALLFLAAAVQGIQYVYTFRLVHSGDLAGLATAGGLLTGVVIVGAVAFAGGRLPAIRAKRARVAAWVAFLILLTVSPFILTPINFYSMLPALRATIGGYAWLLAGLVASVPELAIALVAFSDRSLLPTAQAAGTWHEQAAARHEQATARHDKTTLQPARVYACNYPGCEYKTNKPSSFAAHIGHHKQKERVTSLTNALFDKVKGGEQ